MELKEEGEEEREGRNEKGKLIFSREWVWEGGYYGCFVEIF